MWIRSLGGEDPLEKGMATRSSFLAWRILWTEEPGGCSSQGHKESDTTEADLAGTFLQEIGERAAMELYYALDAS